MPESKYSIYGLIREAATTVGSREFELASEANINLPYLQ